MPAEAANHQPDQVWVCFAVKEEAGVFRRRLGAEPRVRVLLTGMGATNAERVMRAEFSRSRPALVISSGFAGGLRPGWPTGTLVFQAGPETALVPALTAAGAQPAQFLCAATVAVTAADKQALRVGTGADAVEMESQVIAAVCREHHTPCATLRVILDTAEEDLPIDFNSVMTADQRLDLTKLAWSLAKSPGKIGGLIRLQRQTRLGAQRLADALALVLAKQPAAPAPVSAPGTC